MSKSKKTIRPLGHTLLDIEPLLYEMVNDHDLQKSDVLALIAVWIDVHAPHAIEVYTEDNSSPQFYYGPPKNKSK